MSQSLGQLGEGSRGIQVRVDEHPPPPADLAHGARPLDPGEGALSALGLDQRRAALEVGMHAAKPRIEVTTVERVPSLLAQPPRLLRRHSAVGSR